MFLFFFFFFFQAEDGIRDYKVTGVQTCALPISTWAMEASKKEITQEARIAVARLRIIQGRRLRTDSYGEVAMRSSVFRPAMRYTSRVVSSAIASMASSTVTMPHRTFAASTTGTASRW